MITNISVEKLWPHPDNPRKDLGDLSELAESIKARGIMQNLTVVPWFSGMTRVGCDDPKKQEEMGYTVVIGHRRLAAARLAGLKELPCVISDMCQKDQVATMLLENMQRSDLTLYEQAQGFQMMLNLGESMTTIAEKTGFSESTVRKRVKMAELDQDKLKKSMDRGATLMDFGKLEKISDINLRNKVLETIGTPNFNWTLQNAIDEEEMPIRKAALIGFLSEFAEPVTNVGGLEYVKYFPKFATRADWGQHNSGDFKKPDDSDIVKYYYKLDKDSATLYREWPKNNENPKEDPKQVRFEMVRSQLQEKTKMAYEMRIEFVRKYVGAKKHSQDVHDLITQVMLQNTYYNASVILQELNLAPTESVLNNYHDQQKAEKDLIFEEYLKNPERVGLIIAYCRLADSVGNGYAAYAAWKNSIAWAPNYALDTIYEYLGKLGYEISDEERQLQDGTHELFEEETEFEVLLDNEWDNEEWEDEQ